MMHRFELRYRQLHHVLAVVLLIAGSLATAERVFAQQGDQGIPRNQTDPRALQLKQGQNAPVQQVAATQPIQRPFPPLAQAENARLQQLLNAWEKQSQSTKTLTCDFAKWHYDLQYAPAGVHASKSTGAIKYSAPDLGLFQEKTLMFYNGMEKGKPAYAPRKNQAGDYWVCNGKEVIEFDTAAKKCTITSLPPAMQGAQIFNSPLPFVFNLNAQQIQQRYWVREVKSPKEGTYLIEAWPKRQQDRAQYRLVQIILSSDTFLPDTLLMYAPNFNAKTAPIWDHYEFKQVKKNSVGAALQRALKGFVPKPPAGWAINRQEMPTGGQSPQAQARAPQSTQRQ